MLTQLVFNHSLRIRVKADTQGKNDARGESASSNNMGKIYNIATSDVINVIDGREFIQIGTRRFTSGVRLRGLSRVFLQCSMLQYRSRWAWSSCTRFSVGGKSDSHATRALTRCIPNSAFVGLVTILALFPVPGYISTFLRRAQAKKMRKVRWLAPVFE